MGAEPKRFNPDLCESKHRVINARLKEVKDIQTKQGDDIVDLKEIVVRLTTLNEDQERGNNNGSFLNSPAGLLMLKVGIVLFVVMFSIATGFNILSYIN